MDSQDKIKLDKENNLENSNSEVLEVSEAIESQESMPDSSNTLIPTSDTASSTTSDTSETPSETPIETPSETPSEQKPAPKKRGRKKKVVEEPKKEKLPITVTVEENNLQAETYVENLQEDLEEPIEKNPNLPTQEDLEVLEAQDWDISKKSEDTQSESSKPELWEVENIEKTNTPQKEQLVVNSSKDNSIDSPVKKVKAKKKDTKQKAKLEEQISQEPAKSGKPKKSEKSRKSSKSSKSSKSPRAKKEGGEKEKTAVKKEQTSKKEVKPLVISGSLKKETKTEEKPKVEVLEEDTPKAKRTGLSPEQVKTAKKIGIVLGILLAGAALTALVALNLQKVKETAQSIFQVAEEEENKNIFGPPIPMETPIETNQENQDNQGNQRNQGNAGKLGQSTLLAENNTENIKESTAKIKILPQNRGLKSSPKAQGGQTKLPTKENQFCVIDSELDKIVPSTINPKKRYFSIIHPDDPTNRIVVETSTQALVSLLDNKSIKTSDKARITLGSLNPKIKSKYKQEIEGIAKLLGSREIQSYSIEEYQIISKED